ncbi:hypothetical protein GCM10010123_31520 [Pilimelia anulata]|uniref:Cell envelope-related transcriptional attenuator domain-containing protein n=1 Tax=Pilimelia anulata TaxID=53371 RepID=A0A8J3BD23_9ACTN|nr:LCP family protein [Pilimelia anulata]GGJ99307.1 hypothetical protein GCM10010123_31520 [Pilimelia anulata]
MPDEQQPAPTPPTDHHSPATAPASPDAGTTAAPPDTATDAPPDATTTAGAGTAGPPETGAATSSPDADSLDADTDTDPGTAAAPADAAAPAAAIPAPRTAPDATAPAAAPTPAPAPAAAGIRRARRPWVVVTAAAVVAAALVATLAVQAVRTARDGAVSALLPGAADLLGATPAPPRTPAGLVGRQLRGPLNILIVGIDPRQSDPNWRPNADAVLLLHVPRALDTAYLYSLPRDLVVDIPAFAPAGFAGERTKLTHAMSFGSVVPGRARPDRAQGFRLLSLTVSKYTGIPRFDAGAVLDFGGFTKLVDAVGGVDLRVDRLVTSIHRQPDGKHREPGASSTGYVGPQMVYRPGVRHFTGWQALDYGRQRYLPGSDYTRQKHQQQLIRAILTKLVKQGAHRDAAKLARILAAVRDSLTYDGRGHSVVDFAYSLRRVTPARMTLVSLPGDAVGSGGGYRGEALQPVGRQFLRAVRADAVRPFLARNTGLVHSR